MHKDIMRNLSLGFLIGFLLGWWWTITLDSTIGKIRVMLIFGIGGMVLGYIETIVQRSRKKTIEEGKPVKWWQKEDF